VKFLKLHLAFSTVKFFTYNTFYEKSSKASSLFAYASMNFHRPTLERVGGKGGRRRGRSLRRGRGGRGETKPVKKLPIATEAIGSFFTSYHI
jgi:hypothetical protein